MRTAILTFTMAGDLLAHRHFAETDFHIYGKSTDNMVKKNEFGKIWETYDTILFISASGIAIRYIAPYIVKKDRDPAILVMDDGGRFVISLLSGHLGGANDLAHSIASKTGAIEVITTASDARGIEAIDLFAKRNQYYIEDLSKLAPVTGAMVDGEIVGFFSEEDILIDYPKAVRVENLEELNHYANSIAVTSRTLDFAEGEIAYLRPKNLHLGVGSKRGTEYKNLFSLLTKTMEEYGYSIHSIKDIHSIDIKKDEKSIIELSECLQIPFYTHSAEELKFYEDQCSGSEFVRQTVGVNSVSCTSAFMGGRTLLFDKIRGMGFALSLTKE